MPTSTKNNTKIHWSVLALATSLLVAALMSETIDGPLAKWAQTFNSDLWETITEFGKSEWVLVPTLVCFLLLLATGRFIKNKRRKLGVRQVRAIMAYLFSIVALPGIVVALLKQLIGRARPEHLETLGAHFFDPFSGNHDFASMPSGHTVTSFAFAWGISFLWPNLRWPVFAIAIIISLSRPIVGAHYFSDILVGFTFAAMSVFGIRFWMAKRRRLFQLRDGNIEQRPLNVIKRLF